MELQTDKSVLVEVARLYYEHQMSQREIAVKVGTSRPSVSRLLQQARDEGIVHIEIVDPARRGTHIEQILTEKFGLKKAIVVPYSDRQTPSEIKKHLGEVAARYLNELVFDECTLGISWGTTMRELVQHLIPKTVKNMTVVQLVGGITHAQFDPHASEIAQKVGENFNANSYFLLLPTIVDSAEVKQAMMTDKRTRETLDLARRADIILCSVGVFKTDSLLIQAGYFSPKEIDRLIKADVVGDICSRMIDHEGQICWPELDARTVAIELSDLQKVSYSIAVAGGEEKKEVILAGLRRGYFNVLITDEAVGEYLSEADVQS